MGAWQRIRSRGLRYTFGRKFNQLVPAWLFRFRVFRVYRLEPLASESGIWNREPMALATGRTNSESNPTPPEASAYGSELSGSSTSDDVASVPMQFRWCQSPAEIETAQQLTYFRSDAEDQSERFRACLAHRGAKVVGGVWQGQHYFDEVELGVRVMLKDDQAWIFAALVAKSARGQKIYPQLLNHVLNDHPQRRHYASINSTNRVSIAAHRHFVSAETAHCVAIRFLSLTLCWAGPGLSVSRHLTFDGKRNPIEITIQV